MKLNLFLIFLTTASLLANNEGYGQNQRVDINISSGSIIDIFNQIENQSEYKIFYKIDALDLSRKYDMNAKETYVSDVLEKLLNGTNVSYEVIDKIIVITPSDLKQELTVNGTIKDAQGVPLPGVNIVEKGTTNGTITDLDGNYSISLGSANATLVFSFVGYLTEEIEAGGQTTIDLILVEDIMQLEEIVVVGYGTQRKADVTGSVSRISTETTADLPNHTVLQALQGQIAGVNIASPERPGQDPSFQVRGQNSLTAKNTPLIVVDGIIYNGSISDFNPNDIETIDVLKDASAAAVYGSRSANGVLLITTKKGKTEKPMFSFNTYFGIQEPESLIKVMDGAKYEQKMADYNAILLDADPNASIHELTNIEQANKDNGIETDWMDKSMQTGIVENYHLGVSGMTEKTNYYIAGTYFNQEGIAINDKFERITLNMNFTNKITDWFSVSVKSAFASRDYSGLEANLEQATRQSPYGNFYDEDGPGGYAFLPIGDFLGEHPFMNTLIDDVDKRISLWGLVSSNIEVPFVPGLKWTLNYSNNYRNNRFNRFYDNETTVGGQVQNGYANKEDQKYYDWTLDNILNYRKLIANKHSFDVTLLLSREYRNIDEIFAQGSNFVSQALGFNDLDLAEVHEVSSNLEAQNSIAQMARLNYSFDERYAFTFTFRRDGFSAFAEGNKYSNFPAAAFAWTLTNEKFMQEINWLDYLKLRLSYGKNGNQAIGRYSSLARIGTDNYLFGNGGSSVATFNFNSLANESLTWETTLSKNIGIDFQIVNNKISGSVDAYMSNTQDLLQQRSLPRISGFGSVLTNIGEIENKGIEFTLNTQNITKAKFTWNTGFIFSLNRNKIVSLGGLDADGDGVEDDDISNSWFIGHDINTIFGYKTNGIYQLDEEMPSGFRPGDFRIVDVNNDGELTPDDRTILGISSPNYRFSITNTFTYKQFSLYTLVNSVQGGGNNNYYLADNYETRSVNRKTNTTFSERFNLQDVPYWTPDNPTNEYPRLDYNPVFPHEILEDKSFIRIQDVTLSYRFNDTLLNKIKFEKLRVFASIKNLYTFTKWTGYNPETASTIRDIPFLRSYTIGLDFNF